MSFSTGYSTGFFSGGALSELAPYLYPVALDGHPYLVDRKSNQFRHVTIPLLKAQQQDGQLGEASINPQGLWRRSVESWHKGAGQVNFDLADSDPARFRSSKGVDPWTRWALSLLPATDAKRSSANTNLTLQPAGARLYLIDGGDIVYTTDVTVDSPTWTGITGEPATAATSITSDGYTVYTAHGADRVYSTNTAASSTAAFVTSGNPVSLVGYVKGRLMAAYNNLLYNITATGALPAPLYTHPNTDFDWVDFAEGRNVIYAAGYSGDKCVDATTEVLTRRGWLRHDQLTTDDEALALDPATNQIKWDQIEAVNRYDWDGPLERWKSARFDAMSTPSHRWMTANRGKHHGYRIPDGPFKFLTTAELRERPYTQLKVGGGHPEEFTTTPVFSDEMVELVGWTVTEGTYRPRMTGVYISQSVTHNPDHVERLTRLVKSFAATGATASRYGASPDGNVIFYFGKGIGGWLREVAPNRQLTPEFLASLTRSQAELLWETLIDGDGHRVGDSVSWAQKDQGRIDGCQMLAGMLGKRTHQHAVRANGVSHIGVHKAHYSAYWTMKVTQEHYRGVVWCPTTASGTWFARRNGHTYWTGNSLIYKTAVLADGTALAIPTVAGELPDGEIVRAIRGYLGFLLIGTDKGVRFAVQDANGDLTIGALVETASAVLCFEGQGSFVWWGCSNYDAASTGLGRFSLTTLNESTPAYASDLMASTQGAVLSVVTFQGVRVFTVSGVGVYAEDTALVASGTLDSGLISFGIPDDKIALLYDLRHDALAGSVMAGLALDGSSSFTTIATSSTAGTPGEVYPVGELTGERFELRLTLTRGAVTTTGPSVTRHVLSMNPTADNGFFIHVPVLLSTVDEIGGQIRPRDPAAELVFIENLRASRDVVTYQEGSRSYAVSVEDFEWVPMIPSENNEHWDGTCVLTLKVV